MPAERRDLIRFESVSKHFGNVRALEKVDFDLQKREVMGLVGDNGAGKSTLIKIICGIYRPTRGRILFEEEPVAIRSPQAARQLGITAVHQHLALAEDLTIAENICLTREPTRLGFLLKRKMRETARSALSSLKISVDSVDSRVAKLSGGQRQAVAIGRALHTTPRIMIMDEPTAALAVKEGELVLETIRALRDRNISIIFISHVLEEVLAVADRVTVLLRGHRVCCMDRQDLSKDLLVSQMMGHVDYRE